MSNQEIIDKLLNEEMKLYQVDGEVSASEATDIRREFLEQKYGLNLSNISNYTLDNGILYVPIGTKSAYQSALYWKDFKNIEEFSEFNEELINYVAEYSAIEDVVIDKAQQSNNIGIYTIDGRYLGKRDEMSLSPGIYIIDGHKTIVR